MGVTTFMKKVAVSLQALGLVAGFGLATVGATVVAAAPAYADQGNCDPNNLSLSSGAACGQANGTSNNLFAQNGLFQTVANTLIFLVGAVSVIFLIIGGLRYVVSQGDSKNVSAAKDTILYAIIGIVVAVVSFALVNFVITALSKSS